MNYEVIGIDHIYLSVMDVNRSEKFYDTIMPILGFRKNSFTNEGDQHAQLLQPPLWDVQVPGFQNWSSAAQPHALRNPSTARPRSCTDEANDGAIR